MESACWSSDCQIEARITASRVAFLVLLPDGQDLGISQVAPDKTSCTTNGMSTTG